MMALMAIVALGAYADDEPEFTVTSGSFVDVVRQPGKTATVEFNYLDAKTGNLRSKSLTDKTLREKLATEDEDVFKDWDDILENSKEYFVKRWNEEKKKNDSKRRSTQLYRGTQTDQRFGDGRQTPLLS